MIEVLDIGISTLKPGLIKNEQKIFKEKPQ